MRLIYAKLWVIKYLTFHPCDVAGYYMSNRLYRAVVNLSHRVYKGHGKKGHNARQNIRQNLCAIAKHKTMHRR